MTETSIDRFIDGGPTHQRTALGLYALAGAQAGATTPLSAQELIDQLAFIAALMIQGDPRLTTNQQVRLVGEQVGKDVAAYVRAIRARDAKGGKPVMAYFSEGGQGFASPEPGAPTN